MYVGKFLSLGLPNPIKNENTKPIISPVNEPYNNKTELTKNVLY